MDIIDKKIVTAVSKYIVNRGMYKEDEGDLRVEIESKTRVYNLVKYVLVSTMTPEKKYEAIWDLDEQSYSIFCYEREDRFSACLR